MAETERETTREETMIGRSPRVAQSEKELSGDIEREETVKDGRRESERDHQRVWKRYHKRGDNERVDSGRVEIGGLEMVAGSGQKVMSEIGWQRVWREGYEHGRRVRKPGAG